MVWLTGSLLWLLVAGFPVQPAPGEYCTDGAGLITADDREKINGVSRALLKSHGVPIHVVTVRALASHGVDRLGIEAYARRLFDHWGIGSAKHNYGILLLVAKVDRKARIEFGASWARDRDDAAHRIMQRLILPAFRDGEFSLGIVRGVRGLDAMVRGDPLPNFRGKRSGGLLWLLGFVIVVVVLFVVIKSRERSRWSRRVRARTGSSWRRLMLKRALRDVAQGYGTDFWSSGSGGGFSGGGGGGGGFSGGGGATGSW
jgi:uncharacterized protein